MEGPTPKGHSDGVWRKEPHLNVAMGLQTLRGTELGRFPFEKAVRPFGRRGPPSGAAT